MIILNRNMGRILPIWSTYSVIVIFVILLFMLKLFPFAIVLPNYFTSAVSYL